MSRGWLTILWFLLTLAAGASFAIIYMRFRNYSFFEGDESEADYDCSLVTVGGKFYTIPRDVAIAVMKMNKCAELLATDLAEELDEPAAVILTEYMKKAGDVIEK